MTDNEGRRRPTAADLEELESAISEAIYACDPAMQREVCEHCERVRLDIAPLLDPSLGKRVMGDRVCGLAKTLFAHFPRIRTERVVNAMDKVFGKRRKTRTGLSPPAKLLLERLTFHQGKNDYAWPKQQTLAEYIGRSERQIRRYIAELVNAGCIEVWRPDMAEENHYRVLASPKESPNTKEPPDTDDRCHRTRMTGATGHRRPQPPDTGDLSHRTRMTGLHEEHNETKENSSSEAAPAAADLCASLGEFGITASEEELVNADPTFAAMALAHLRTRVADPAKAPIGPGYAIALLRNPAGFGFRRGEDGAWSPGADPAQVRTRARQEAAQRQKEERLKTITPEEMKAHEARLKLWDGLAETAKEKVYEKLSVQWGTAVRANSRAPNFIGACLQCAKKLGLLTEGS